MSRFLTRSLSRRTLVRGLGSAAAGLAVLPASQALKVAAQTSSQSSCSNDPGVAMLLELFEDRYPIPPQQLMPPPTWPRTVPDDSFAASIAYPPDWVAQTFSLTDVSVPQSGGGLRLTAATGTAAFEVWFIAGSTSPTPQQAMAYGLQHLLGQNAATASASCAIADSRGPLAFGAVTTGALTAVSWGWLATAGNPGGYAMAGPVDQFAALTQQVFLPVIYQFGCGIVDCAAPGPTQSPTPTAS